MHLCRIFTWHLFVANFMLILLMISAAPIPFPLTSQLPSESKKRPFSEFSVEDAADSHTVASEQQRAYKPETPQNYYIIVYPRWFHQLTVKRKKPNDPKMVTWTAGLVPAKDRSDLSSKLFQGYQTQWESPCQWKIAGVEKNGKHRQGDLNGATVRISKKTEYPPIFIGNATTTKSALRNKIFPTVHAAVIGNHSDIFPNPVSTYQFLIHLEKVLEEFSPNKLNIKPPLVTNLNFDISDSSDFVKAFNEMIRKKESAAGFQLDSRHPWELDLYNRIETGKLKVPQMVENKNKEEMEIRRKYAAPLEPENPEDASLDWIGWNQWDEGFCSYY
ncbi:hypothetical protein EV361DRAFT_867674 [Lentinula raphanica]|nr:hypothetical protein EV361DRAFT_867674 [Lentinula raphanica]